jgi:hypothetical protein
MQDGGLCSSDSSSDISPIGSADLLSVAEGFAWPQLQELLSHPVECAYALFLIEKDRAVGDSHSHSHSPDGRSSSFTSSPQHQQRQQAFSWFPSQSLEVLRAVASSSVFRPSALTKMSPSCAR